MRCSKSSYKKKSHIYIGLPQETEQFQINNRSLLLKNLEKDKQNKTNKTEEE